MDFTIKYFPVSFSGPGSTYGTRNEPVSLATMDRDCFIIPAQSLDRFLPAGIPVNRTKLISFKNILFINNYY